MKVLKIRIAAISLIVSLSACQTGFDTQSNLVFDKNAPSSKAYKNELAVKIKANPSGLIYTFNKYFESNGQDFLYITITGEDFKANGLVLVQNWDKLENIRRTKGIGYLGAELEGLRLNIKENSDGAMLVCAGLEKILD